MNAQIKRPCSIPECNGSGRTRGWCDKHYKRWLLHGDPLREPLSVADRLWSKVDASGICWEWTAYKNPKGYGHFYRAGRWEKAHRVAYELLVGPIPRGLELDHLCRNRACVNPDHLEPVTRKVNNLRGSSPTSYNARRTECAKGHPFDLSRRGKRYCPQCESERRQTKSQNSVAVTS